MAWFVMWMNNSVTAVVSEEVWKKLQVREELVRESISRGQPVYPPVLGPIFTFSDSPTIKEWVTGSLKDMRELLEGHKVTRDYLYVPFSNGIQDWKDDPWGSAEAERRFRTTLREAIGTFGLVPKHRAPTPSPA